MTRRVVVRGELDLEYECDGCGLRVRSAEYGSARPPWDVRLDGVRVRHWCAICAPKARATRIYRNRERAERGETFTP